MGRIARFACLLSFVVVALVGKSYGQVSNTWSSAGQMSQVRTGAAAVLLRDGTVLITGGSDASGLPMASAEFFSPTTGAFSPAPAMNVARANHAAILLTDGEVLVTGGATSGGAYSDTAEIYNPATQQWTLLNASLGTGRTGHAMALLTDGNVLIAGGESASGPVATLQLFNMADHSITSIGSLITARTDAAAAATPDGRVLIAGGTDSNNNILASTEIFVYAPSTLTGSISAGPAMSYARSGATATSTYDGVAIIGGYNVQNGTQTDLGTAEIFSQWTSAFRVVSGATPRSGHFAVMLPANGSILAMGGTGGQAVDLLQPWANNTAGAFVAAASSQSNHNGGFAASAGLGAMLAAGGQGSAAGAAELYRFPTISTDQPDYAPGTQVAMTGTGFLPGETVDLHLHEWVNQATTDTPDYKVTALSDGTFSFSGYAPTTTDIGARYHLTAVGESSGLQAQKIFTDAPSHSNVEFLTAGLPSDTSITLASCSYTNPGGHVKTCAQIPETFAAPGSTTDEIQTSPNTSFSYAFPPTITSGGATYNLISSLPSSPFTTGSSGVTTTVTGTYALATIAVTASLTASNKTYDGTSTEPDANMSCTLSGVHSGDTVTCTASAGTFASASVGAGISVTATVTLGGADVAKYTLGAAGTTTTSAQATTTASITPKTLSVSGITASDKTYDGTTAAMLNTSGATLVGVVSGDTVSLNVSGATGAFSGSNVGTSLTVTISGLTLNNNTAGNYQLPTPQATATANITPAPLTAAVTAAAKQYDGTTAATLTCSLPSGVVAGDVVNCTAAGAFASKDVATPQTVNITSIVLGGGPAGNYALTASTGTTSANITPAPLTITAVNESKTYGQTFTPDGTTQFSITAGTLYSGDAVSSVMLVSSGYAATATVAGSPYTITPSNAAGTGLGNYSITYATTGTMTVNPATPTLSLTCTEVTYDGNAHSCAGMATGVGGAAVSGTWVYSPASEVNAGSYPTTGTFTSADSNYVSGGTAGGTLKIDQANATINVTAYNVVYDGNAHTATGSATGVGGVNLTADLNLSGTTHTAAGNYTDTWTFHDASGNYADATGTVKDVINHWTVTGFYSPVVPTTSTVVWNVVKGGSTVPLKFNIYAGTVQQTSTAAVQYGSVVVYQANCNIGGIANTVTDYLTDTGATTLRFDTTGLQFIQNWKTPKGTGCYVAQMTAVDGTSIQAYFTTN